MAIRNEKLGGTDFSDGEVLYSQDLNDTNDAILGGFTYTRAADSAISTTSVDWVTLTTTIIPADTLIIGNINVFADANFSSSYYRYIRIDVDGDKYNEVYIGGGSILSTIASVNGLDKTIAHTITIEVKKTSANNWSCHGLLRVQGR